MKSFTAGLTAAWLAIRTVNQLVLSDTQFGREVRKKVIGKMDHDRLLRLEREVTLEIAKRREQQR